MNDATIRLDDLRRLTVLLPDTTPPRAVSEVARWAVEMKPVGENMPLCSDVEVETDRLEEIVARFSDPAAVRAHEPPAPADAPPTAAIANLQAPQWTEEEAAKLLAARIAGRTFAQIAEELGRTQKACEVRFRKLRQSEPQSAVVSAAPKVRPNAAASVKPTAPTAVPQRPAGGDLVSALAGLDDSFEPEDDKLLVEKRYLGVGFPGIADELGCDDATVKARWRSILRCGVANSGGIVTAKGWTDLRTAVALRAEQAEG